MNFRRSITYRSCLLIPALFLPLGVFYLKIVLFGAELLLSSLVLGAVIGLAVGAVLIWRKKSGYIAVLAAALLAAWLFMRGGRVPSFVYGGGCICWLMALPFFNSLLHKIA